MDQDVVYRFSESGIEASDKDLRKKLGGAKLAYFAREPSCIYMTVWNRPRKWWAVQGSNLRPLPCEDSALPAELTAHHRDDR